MIIIVNSFDIHISHKRSRYENSMNLRIIYIKMSQSKYINKIYQFQVHKIKIIKPILNIFQKVIYSVLIK